MIDIHSHVVWGLDDGASSIQDSLTMLGMAWKDGVTDIVASPHQNGRFQLDPSMLRQHIGELAGSSEGRPLIHIGCEFRLNVDNIGRLLESPSAYTINSGPYLLLEFPGNHIGSHTESVLRHLLDAGIVPVVVHPERNPILLRDFARLESWVELGCLAQVTAGSITGEFGGLFQSAALSLLDRGLIHVVASDAHDCHHRPPLLSPACHIVRTRLGEETAELLFTDNPRSIIQGEQLPAGKLMLTRPPKRHWWQVGLRHAVN
jgi:protein-tyrosine phosphatase